MFVLDEEEPIIINKQIDTHHQYQQPPIITFHTTNRDSIKDSSLPHHHKNYYPTAMMMFPKTIIIDATMIASSSNSFLPRQGTVKYSAVDEETDAESTILVSWKVSGGDLCYQLPIIGADDVEKKKNVLDCGADGAGGTISEIDTVFIGKSHPLGSNSSRNCMSLFDDDENRSKKTIEQIRYESKLLSDIKKRCIGQTTCRLLGFNHGGKWLKNYYHEEEKPPVVEEELSLFIRGRCSVPFPRITLEVESKSPTTPISFELFVPTFGIHKPQVIKTSEKSSSCCRIEHQSDRIAAHPLLSSMKLLQTVETGIMHSVSTPAVSIVDGVLLLSATRVVTVEISSTKEKEESHYKSKSVTLFGDINNRELKMITLGTCAQRDGKTGKTSSKVILKVDRIDSHLIHRKCKSIINNKKDESFGILQQIINKSCIGKESCLVSIDELLTNLFGASSLKKKKTSASPSSFSCLAAISQAITFVCGDYGDFFYTEEDVQNGHN